MEDVKPPAKWDLDSDEIASVASEDLHRNRPNRWTGPKSSWRSLTAEERQLWRSMRQLEHQDLAVHLYDTFALKRQGRDPATAGLLTIQTDDGNEAVWAPPKQWTAWPLREKHIPREHLVRRQDDEDERFTIRRGEAGELPSTGLQDELGATVLRLAKERFRKRKRWQPVRASIESAAVTGIAKAEPDDDGDDDDEDDNDDDGGVSLPSSPPMALKLESVEESAGKMQLDRGSPGRASATVASKRLRSTSTRKEKTYEPMVSTNDELSYSLLQPSVRHILSQLDKTLGILHNARIAGLCHLSESPSDSDSDSQPADGAMATTTTTTPRKRSRGRPRRTPQPGDGDDDDATKPRTASRRGRPRKVHVPREGETEDEMRVRVAREGHRRLPFTQEDRDAAFEEWLRRGDQHAEERRRRRRSMSSSRHHHHEAATVRSARASSAAEGEETEAQSQADYDYDDAAAASPAAVVADDDDDDDSNVDRKLRRWGLRDWSDVVGAAALAGFPEDVIKRTTRRCADLFGEGMVLRRLDEAPSSRGPGFHTTEYQPQRIRLSSTASASSSSSDEEVRPTLRQRRLASLASTSPSTPTPVRRRSSLSRGRATRSATPGAAAAAAAAAAGSPPSSSRARTRSRSRSSAGLLFCPVAACDRAARGFERRANLRRHMLLVHPGRADNDKCDSDEGDDEAVGAVRVDGFLRTIQVGRGWRAEDVAERKRKAFWGGRPVRGARAAVSRRGRMRGSEDDDDDDGDDDGDDEAGDESS
ncbi:RNA polymerase I specific transcription initiation factor [Purpureocillium lavendulum]|uniref:RNA polymerase I specific transcription initiation factor n=1 Tax=Purpureocillium lavendulum TaxID=1247861 RepID=A0AB34FX12_9HYPO|nr:RNA polymerase I specific transcription initiation factor [Purpureocillium lavendulum]